MDENELKNRLEPLINDLKSDLYSEFRCFKNHMLILEQLRNGGVSITAILALSGLKFNNKQFSNLLSRFKRSAS
ncbi:MAG: hypothetical protein ACRCWR_08880 [Saezia sp.]